MTDKWIKEKINLELDGIRFTDSMKQSVLHHRRRSFSFRAAHCAAAAAAVIILGGTTAFAGYMVLNRVHVNEETLPELDEMKVTEFIPFSGKTDEAGLIDEPISGYQETAGQMGLHLLDTELAADSTCAEGSIYTDNKDFAILSVKNYIIGDTYDYVYLPEEGRYQYESGTEYVTPVSLTVEIILSDSQLETGWDTDYLGMYEYVDSYTSGKGYKVNLIQDTAGPQSVEGYVSEKCAVFVADGIRYTLKGRTSWDTMKRIVDSMRQMQ